MSESSERLLDQLMARGWTVIEWRGWHWPDTGWAWNLTVRKPGSPRSLVAYGLATQAACLHLCLRMADGVDPITAGLDTVREGEGEESDDT